MKSSGIFSKIYTISLVFLILAVVSYLVAFALVTFSPEEVGPKLERMGISLKWFGHEGANEDSSPLPNLLPRFPPVHLIQVAEETIPRRNEPVPHQGRSDFWSLHG